MPVISRFFGIVIFMYWRDHSPPHFHAKYGDDEIKMSIKTGDFTGQMSRRELEKFKKFRVDPELQTIVWENGADLAPEFLYENMKVSV
jgi:Domain of unknown function (DUF4160)/Protein of unknown function (DUF2442)